MTILISCKTQLRNGKYKSNCYTTDAPSKILILDNHNKYIMIYPASVEKVGGTWKIKKDTLVLKSLYQGSLSEKDSSVYNSEIYYIIKRNKLIDPKNRKCFLIK